MIGQPFIPGWTELRPFVAELWLIGTIIAVLLAPFGSKRPNFLCGVIALLGLVLALASLLIVGNGPETIGPHFRGLLVADSVSYLWKILLLVFTFGVVLMWFATTAVSLHEGDGPEFFTLLLGATLGMCLMASTHNLLMLFMAVEMASLPSYVLAGFRKTHRVGAEASLKYVLFGAATSAIMVYGLSLLYGLYGTLDLPTLAGMMAHSPIGSPLLAVGLLGLIVGIGFKISAVPFHMWCPDVFEGASIDVTTFLSVASKGAALVLLMRVMMIIGQAFGFAGGSIPNALAIVIGLLGLASATVGNTAAFFQNNIKRLLAYSSIAHAGYMLCVISLLVRNPASEKAFEPATSSAQAILFYLAVYLFMNLGAFTVTALVTRQVGSEDIQAFSGLSKRSVLLAACMAVFMFSLVGLPPLAGFSAKFTVLWALIQNGSWWWILVVGIGINTIFSLYFYLRVVRVMYLDKSDQPAFAGAPLGMGISVACALMLLVMFFVWSPLGRLTSHYQKLYLSEKASSPTAAVAGDTAFIVQR